MDSRRRSGHPVRLKVDGPLAAFTDGMRAGLAAQGYARDTITDHVHLLAGLSGWLGDRKLTAADLTEGAVEEFAADRRRRGCRAGVSPRAMIPVVEYLRGVGAAPPASEPEPRTPQEVMLAAYRAYLAGERGVSAGTAAPLAGAVPAGRAHPRPARPRAATAAQVQAVLAACDRDCAAGRRDYAILLVMARLALRGGEVARIELSDIDWRAATVTIRGKGGRTDVLPLPADVGAAIADYLVKARPPTVSRRLFVIVVAPFRGMAVSSVTQLVQRACKRAGVPAFGPHGMRHAAACALLAAGAGMEEIGQLLRHAQERTTAIYAKVDQARLARLARPCPEGSAR